MAKTTNTGQWYGKNRWWIQRIIQLPIDIFIFSTIAFFFVRMMPGDPARAVLSRSGNTFTEADVEHMRVTMGISGSVWQQLWTFWSGLTHGDFGISIATGRPVSEEIWSRFPATLELVLLGMILALIVALGLGLLWVMTSSGTVKKAVRLYASLATSIPVFVVAVFGIMIFYVMLKWAPAPLGRLDGGTLPVLTGFPLLDEILTGEWVMLGQTIAHYVLPLLAIALTYAPNLLNQLLNGLGHEMDQPTTKFQIASDVRRPWMYFSLFRRSMSSVVVVFGLLFGSLLGGAVTLEQLFGFGGVGQLATRSVNSVDFPTLQGFLIVITSTCLVVYFLVDVLNMLLDPRRRPGVATEE
ncbi:MAG: ABC transporter permease [Bifidobacterium tibiigranuli]|jgi:peptide/nickel transport system permease protein|uniref:ABC transporter permease n=1 Tax=Bifidobacterium tibiigranuli TaxID=2172043 RepID=UPI0026F1451B|nr:ABC transporter permease [Bifidobacterium tibiigranuli]MCI1673679.1 ABC transporter permease [Bifidobacterium tibiigranuli]MCI1712935.1 ABC transporter permease [Bifidobacterium tibiigranuli]